VATKLACLSAGKSNAGNHLAAVGKRLTAISLVASLLIACSSTQQIYEKAYFSHDVDQLEAFIQEYPSDQYVPDAKRNQAKWLMDEADKNPSIETYEALLKKYPNNPNLYTQASKKLSALYFDQVQKENTRSALENFIQRFPFSRERHFAAVQLDKINFEETVAANTLEAFNKYLVGKPSEENRKRILEKVAKLELDDLQKNESIAAYQAFIEKYKDSALAVEATNRMIDLQLPSSIYDSKKGTILIRWGKFGMIQNHLLKAHYGDKQQQQFFLSSNLVVCNDQNKHLAAKDLPTDSDITIASFANQNQSEVFAIYLGEVKSKMVERDTVLSPGSAVAFELPSCFPPQISVNP